MGYLISRQPHHGQTNLWPQKAPLKNTADCWQGNVAPVDSGGWFLLQPAEALRADDVGPWLSSCVCDCVCVRVTHLFSCW